MPKFVEVYLTDWQKVNADRAALLAAMRQIDDVLLGHMPITAVAKDIARAVLKEIGEA